MAVISCQKFSTPSLSFLRFPSSSLFPLHSSLSFSSSSSSPCLDFPCIRSFSRLHAQVGNKSTEQAPDSNPKVGVSVYKPKSYQVLVSDAVNSLACALEDGKTRLEIDFPPLPSNISSYKMKNKKEAEKTESQLLGIFDYAWNKGGNGIRRQEDVLLKLDKIASGATSDFLSKFQHWKWEAFGKKRVGIKINDSMPSKESETSSDDPKHDLGSRVFKFSRSRPQVVPTKCVVDEDFTICGVALGDGSVCRSRPVEGRKRCGEHKGKSINASVSTSVTNGEVLVKEGKSWPQVVPRKFVVDEDFTICGVALCDGSVCRNRPVEGRKRCGEHKGKRINASVPTSVTYGEVLVKEGKSWPQVVPRKYVVDEDFTICGVALCDGSVCRSRPIEGRKRCGEHKGKRIDGSVSASVTYREVLVKEGQSGVCGVRLGDGSVCMEFPVHGRKRCELHKGRRVTTHYY